MKKNNIASHPGVSCFDKEQIILELKKSPQLIQEYVYALEASNDRWEYIHKEAMNKIRELIKSSNGKKD